MYWQPGWASVPCRRTLLQMLCRLFLALMPHAGNSCAAIDSIELDWLQVETLRKQPLGPGQQSAATDASPDLPPLPTDFPPLPDIKPAPIDEVCSTAHM